MLKGGCLDCWLFSHPPPFCKFGYFNFFFPVSGIIAAPSVLFLSTTLLNTWHMKTSSAGSGNFVTMPTPTSSSCSSVTSRTCVTWGPCRRKKLEPSRSKTIFHSLKRLLWIRRTWKRLFITFSPVRKSGWAVPKIALTILLNLHSILSWSTTFSDNHDQILNLAAYS